MLISDYVYFFLIYILIDFAMAKSVDDDRSLTMRCIFSISYKKLIIYNATVIKNITII